MSDLDDLEDIAEQHSTKINNETRERIAGNTYSKVKSSQTMRRRIAAAQKMYQKRYGCKK